jgi:hypothetical protein
LLRLLRPPSEALDELLGDVGRMIDFLVRFDEERLADPQDYAWVAWQESIALLGLRQLAVRAEAAWADGRISDSVLSVGDFLEDVAKAERAPADPDRFKRRNVGYIEDVLQTLAMWPLESSAIESWPAATNGSNWLRQEPVINPLRKVGRNDPCPCGSGRKAKRCCLA